LALDIYNDRLRKHRLRGELSHEPVKYGAEQVHVTIGSKAFLLQLDSYFPATLD
jgi:hypothetical protein